MGKYKVKIVNCYSLNVRAGTSTSYKVVQWAQRDDIYTSSKQSNGWYYLDSKKGWSSGKYIKVMEDLNEKKTKPKKVTPPKADPPKPTPVKPPTPAPPKVDATAASQALKSGTGSTLKSMGSDTRKVSASSTNYVIENIVPSQNIFKGKNDVQITDYKLDYGFVSNNLDIIRKNINIKGDTRNIKKEMFSKFNRYKVAYPDYYLAKSTSHVFFTRPSLYLLDKTGKSLNSQLKTDPFYNMLMDSNPELVRSLTTHMSASHDFYPLLSNGASSFEVPDEYLKTIEHGETFTGYKMVYGRHSVESLSAGQFSITFQDDSDLNIFRSIKAWVEYINRVTRGDLKPIREHITKRILDYASGVYYFLCGPDGETILFWTKFFGVFPLNVPSSITSWARGNSVKMPELNVNFAWSFKEDLMPVTLAEFNMNCSSDFVYKKNYYPETQNGGRSLSGAPFVSSSKDAYGNPVYKLKFRQ